MSTSNTSTDDLEAEVVRLRGKVFEIGAAADGLYTLVNGWFAQHKIPCESPEHRKYANAATLYTIEGKVYAICRDCERLILERRKARVN